MQITLSKLETKICLKCKRGMKIESIIDEVVTYFCPICMKEYRFTICLNCGILFDGNEGYKLCKQCNKQSIQKLELSTDKINEKIVIKYER